VSSRGVSAYPTTKTFASLRLPQRGFSFSGMVNIAQPRGYAGRSILIAGPSALMVMRTKAPHMQPPQPPAACGPFILGRPPPSVARFGRRPTLPSETLRIPNRPRTAVTVRLSLSDMIVMVFPASTISRSWLSSSGFHGRLPYLGIILTGGANAARTGRATWPIPPFAAGQLTRHQAI